MAAVKAYLFLYNAASAVGWTIATVALASPLLRGEGVAEAVEAALPLVEMLQLASTLELVHALTGLVKSSPVQICLQVGGRDLALFSMVTFGPAVRDSSMVLLVFGSWGLAEIISTGLQSGSVGHELRRVAPALRYPFYALNVLGACPSFLHYLRYTAFIVLYPMGFVGELGTYIVGMFVIQAEGQYEIPALPKGSILVLMAIYLLVAFGWAAPGLYAHMLKQRRKQLGGTEKKKAT